MAFDFPASPANGTVSNGYTWSAAAGMWVGGPGVSGPVTEQYFDLSGKTQQDVTVPTWAKGVEIVASLIPPPAATGSTFAARVSMDGTTFFAGASDYYVAAPFHQSLPTAAFATQPAAPRDQLVLSIAGTNVTVPHLIDAFLTLERRLTSEVLPARSFTRAYDNTSGSSTAWFYSWVVATTPGSALRIAALRFFMGGSPLGNGSFLKLKWHGDSAAIPATNAIADAPNDAYVYLRGQNAWKSGGILSGDLTMSKVQPTIILDRTNTTSYPSIFFKTSGLYRWGFYGNGDTANDLVIGRYDDAGAYLNAPLVIDRANGGVAFTGNLGIGSSPYAQPGAGNTTVGVTVTPPGQVIASTASVPTYYMNNNSSGGWVAAISCAGTAKGSISVTTSAVSFNTTSDGRLKEDRKAFDAGPLIDATNVYDFLWKDTTTRGYGVVAQEAIAVLPDAVNHNEEQDSWGVDYSKYVPLLLQEVKALRARVAELEAVG